MLVFLKRVVLKRFEWCWKREKVLCKKVVQKGACLDSVTWICPSGTCGLVYRVRPIKEVDWNKDSKIDLEMKKEGSNPYSTRTLVKP
jgi:hypothetical protein